VRQSIVDFVAHARSDGDQDFVPPADRIAVFDNDGTLWTEQPMYAQLAFALDRVKALAPQHPEWTTTEPFASLLQGDLQGALTGGGPAIAQIAAATHAGMTTEAFETMVYQPMLELLDYLRVNGFRTFILSGGGADFMRVFAEEVYGIPPDQVIGSTGKLTFELRDGGPVLVKLPEIDFVDDKGGKPVGIQKHIGRRPVFAFGNSAGDLQMLQWTAAGGGARFMGIVHHTDAEREVAYDRTSHIGTLDTALDEATAKGWTVVDMKRDWKRLFVFEEREPDAARAGDTSGMPVSGI
jgi:hypothetical protein